MAHFAVAQCAIVTLSAVTWLFILFWIFSAAGLMADGGSIVGELNKVASGAVLLVITPVLALIAQV